MGVRVAIGPRMGVFGVAVAVCGEGILSARVRDALPGEGGLGNLSNCYEMFPQVNAMASDNAWVS